MPITSAGIQGDKKFIWYVEMITSMSSKFLKIFQLITCAYNWYSSIPKSVLLIVNLKIFYRLCKPLVPLFEYLTHFTWRKYYIFRSFFTIRCLQIARAHFYVDKDSNHFVRGTVNVVSTYPKKQMLIWRQDEGKYLDRMIIYRLLIARKYVPYLRKKKDFFKK